MAKFVKRKYKFSPFPALVDVYVDGKKVRERHNANLGQIYLFTESDDVEVKPHDPRVPLQMDLTEDGSVILHNEFIEVPPAKAVKDFV